MLGERGFVSAKLGMDLLRVILRLGVVGSAACDFWWRRREGVEGGRPAEGRGGGGGGGMVIAFMDVLGLFVGTMEAGESARRSDSFVFTVAE